MSHRFRRILLQRAARFLDLVVVSLALVAAIAISSRYFNWPTLAEFLVLRIKVLNILIYVAYLVVCTIILSACGFYLSHRLASWKKQAREIFLATTLITATFLLVPRQMDFATFEFLTAFWLINCFLLALVRALGFHLIYFLRSRGRNLRNLVIVGDGPDAVALAKRIEHETALGYRVLRIITTKD